MKKLFGEARLVFMGNPDGTNKDIVTSGQETMPPPEDSAKKFGLQLITVKQDSQGRYEANPKFLVKFINKSSSAQKKLLQAWVKKQAGAKGYEARDIKDEATAIWKELSPRAKRSNLAKIRGWVKYAANNASELASNKVKEKVKVIKGTLTPTVKSLLSKHAPNITKTTEAGAQKVTTNPKLPKVVNFMKGYLKPKGVKVNIAAMRSGFGIAFGCAANFNTRKLPKIKQGLQRYIQRKMG